MVFHGLYMYLGGEVFMASETSNGLYFGGWGLRDWV